MKTNKTVVVTANPQTGKIFNLALEKDGVTPKKDKNGNQHGAIRVEQAEIDLDFSYSNGGAKTRSAFIPMTLDAWNKVSKFYKDGMEITGKIVIEESLEQKPGFQAKTAGKGGVALTLGGKQIYRGSRVTTLEEDQDVLIQHDNDVKAEMAELAEKAEALNAETK